MKFYLFILSVVLLTGVVYLKYNQPQHQEEVYLSLNFDHEDVIILNRIIDERFLLMEEKFKTQNQQQELRFNSHQRNSDIKISSLEYSNQVLEQKVASLEQSNQVLQQQVNGLQIVEREENLVALWFPQGLSGGSTRVLCQQDERLITGECIAITTAGEYLTQQLQSYRPLLDPPKQNAWKCAKSVTQSDFAFKNVIMRVQCQKKY